MSKPAIKNFKVSDHGRVRAYAPATVANVGCGFDTFGFAIECPGDYVTAWFAPEKGVYLTGIDGDNKALPAAADKNTAGIAVKALLDYLGESRGINLYLQKRMPFGSGMGSSAASAAAAAVAANELLGKPFTKKELLPFVVAGEEYACGSPHSDNAAPSLLGGFVVIREKNEVSQIPVPDRLNCILVHPHCQILTSQARAILPEKVPLKDAQRQWSNTANLVVALYQGNLELFGRCLEDLIIEPVRSALIPGFHEVKETALAAGALGCGISGSGPSVFAFTDNEKAGGKIGKAMQKVFKETAKLESDMYISPINKTGAQIVPNPPL